jgi:hypothetical protein
MNATPLLLAALLLAPNAAVQAPKKPKETFWQKVFRITGISAMPSTSKGPADVASGDLWVATLDSGSRLRLTRDGGYQSPIFAPDGDFVLALREGKLARVSTAGFLDPEPLFPVPGVVRLLGADRETPGQVAVLVRSAEGTLDFGLLDLKDGKVRSLRSEAPAGEYQDALGKLARWDRTWQVGEPPRAVSLTVRPSSGQGSDVYGLREGGEAVDVSRCDGERCGQPALSADGRKVVFVRVHN